MITIRKPGSEVPLRSTDPSLPLPEDAAAGFSSQMVNGERWRIYTLRDARIVIQVAQRSSVRDELEREAALTTLWPTLVLLPLVLVAVLLIVRLSLRKMKPLGDRGAGNRCSASEAAARRRACRAKCCRSSIRSTA